MGIKQKIFYRRSATPSSAAEYVHISRIHSCSDWLSVFLGIRASSLKKTQC